MRRLAAIVFAALLLPGYAPAQVTSVLTRTGAVTAQAGDYTCGQVTNCGPVNRGNTWRGLQVGCFGQPIGCVSPRIGAVFNGIGPNVGTYGGASSENNQFDAVAYNGVSQFVAERYDYNPSGKGSFPGVGANEGIGGFWGAAQASTGSDPVGAGMALYTTEAQTGTNQGVGLELDFTPNGSTGLTRGLSISPQGFGGVTLGGGPSNDPYRYSSPADLGTGTLNAANDIKTAGHYRSGGNAPTLSACGSGPSITGTDAAGAVATGVSTSSCTITFVKAYASAPICMVQTYANATPVAYLSSYTTTQITVSWTTTFHGGFFYLCQGLS